MITVEPAAADAEEADHNRMIRERLTASLLASTSGGGGGGVFGGGGGYNGGAAATPSASGKASGGRGRGRGCACCLLLPPCSRELCWALPAELNSLSLCCIDRTLTLAVLCAVCAGGAGAAGAAAHRCRAAVAPPVAATCTLTPTFSSASAAWAAGQCTGKIPGRMRKSSCLRRRSPCQVGAELDWAELECMLGDES